MEVYGMSRKLDCSYEDAIERVTEALGKEGFGILTEIDVKATLKKKLDKDFRKYIILGACNPSFAFDALNAEREIGLLMPCNVIVYENDEGGGSTVSAINPAVAMTMMDNPSITCVAEEVKGKLEKVLDSI